MKQINRFFTTIFLLASLSFSTSTNAQNALSHSSSLSILSPVVMIAGSVYMFAEMGSLIITSLEPLGESTVIIVEGISEAGKVSAKVVTSTAKEVSLAVGDKLSVSSQQTGVLLNNNKGDLVAFIPNEQTQKNTYQHRRQWKSAL